MTIHKFETIEEIFQATLEIERDIKERATYKPKRYSFTNTWSKNKEVDQSPSKWNKNKDYKSNDKKPIEKTTPKYPVRNKGNKYPTLNPKGFQCSKCQGCIHKVRECPNQRNVILKDGKLYYFGEEVGLEDENDEKDQDGEGSQEGEQVEEDNEDAWPQDGEYEFPNLFGSCDNMASATLDDFLILPITKHATPYKLQWLNDYGELKVNRPVVIRFKVGNYHDEVYCDVIPMQACHLLLGTPWQYDRSSKHDGRTNWYSFEFNGQKFTLHPLCPS
ncbi:hypothetical protein BC332_03177 [Capsicum chinense]|nr:hypothetical protein BC332_03177 [Capsicum chinense]